MDNSIFCYLDNSNGNDLNIGTTKDKAFKTIGKAKDFIKNNGGIGDVYIIGYYNIPSFELVNNDIFLNIIGISKQSEIYYVHPFGDNVNCLKNVNFYKLKVSCGDSRFNYHPYTENVNFYNCIITFSGCPFYGYKSNFYNCIFENALTSIDYRFSDGNVYRIGGKFSNCIFNKNIFNEKTNFISAIKQFYNLSVDNIYFYINEKNKNDISIRNNGDINILNEDGTRSDIGIYGGMTPYIFNFYKFLLKQNQNYYTIKSEFYKNNNYKPITELEGKEVLTQNNFETYGIDDLNLLTKTIDTRVINGIDKGRLGSGKYFEVGLYNCCKRVKSQPVLDYTDNIMPQMNASTVNGITVTASSTEGNYYPYQAFDRNPSNAYAWSSNRYDSPEIRQSANLYINFNTLTRKVSKYKILSYYCYPYDIKLYGSNDNTDWKLLDERNNVVSEYKWYDFEFKNTINYQYYKFNFKTNEEKVFINEMELMELIIPFKYLIEYNSQLYTFNNTEIILSSSQVLDENNFINNGFIDATAITEEQWNTAFSDKSNVKLLMWADDMSKTDVNIETEIIPFRAIDKLKKNSDVYNILFKEV
ncbi:hypothetical protein G4W71_08245 [Clostridium botulinum]|uniref:discoidin domain-containing protein n=1 Tax=Clostridium botulinum TaxID=1491 RepID=UPI0007DEE9A8|nr:discoidin domain-containing protein [Clostridium botulinum]KEI96314.1 hypothetical protein N497_17335 [Clostridium botulinum F 357]MBE1304017.1 hypothetical protein [Clostridium botulinum]